MITLSPYAWLITHDDLASADDPEDTDTTGPAGITETLEIALRRDDIPRGFTRSVFRMYDDDGNRYYRGRMLYKDDLEGTEVQVFAPLKDFGLPHAGCTRIRWNDDHHCDTY